MVPLLLLRKSFMTDIPEKQKKMNVEDPENRGLIRGSINEINRERSEKSQ